MYDDELEKAMLFYLIFEQEEYLLDENDFVSERNKKIIKAINELKAEKKEISLLTVKAKIKANRSQVLEYLVSLGDYVRISSPENIYNELIQLSKKRKLLKILQNKTMEIAESENIDILMQEIIKQINKIEKINEKEKTFTEQIISTAEELEKNTREQKDYSLYTGLGDLDKITCGLHKEELTIIGARPRNRKNNTSITNSRTHSKKRSRNSNNKFRNVRYTNNTKNASKKN